MEHRSGSWSSPEPPRSPLALEEEVAGATFRLAEPDKAQAGWETAHTSHRGGPSGLAFFTRSATKPTPCPGWGQENILRGALGTGQEELGAAPAVLRPHGACCTLTPRSPHTFQLPPHQHFAMSPAPGHICTSPARPLPGEGGEQALLCECWEHWDQGSSIVYYQYLSWPGSTACWRKRGRGRAPNILCIPDNQSKGSTVAHALGGNVRPFICKNPAIKYPGVRFSNKRE